MTATAADRADARQRSFRTLAQSMAVDLGLVVLAAVASAVLPLLEGAEAAAYVTPALWIAVGTAALKSGVVALVAYVARVRSAPPPTG